MAATPATRATPPAADNGMRFVEDFALLLTETGVPRMPARVFACVLADDSGGLTAADLAERLQVSPAAISGAVRWLMQMHLYYFSVRTLRALMERCGFRVVAVTPHRRIVRLNYVLSRAERWSPALAAGLQRAAERVGLGGVLVPVDLGDIFTLYAQRVDAPNGRHNGALHRG